MLLLEIPAICAMVSKIGLNQFYLRLCDNLTHDFSQWEHFQKSPRHAVYVPNGVMELMPICNDELYSFKYVNGHPLNPLNNKLNVVAFGMLAEVATGYPLMISSMTLLTALRTAATSALASKYMAKQNSKRVAIIGCGAQSEFQILAHHALFDLSEVRYFDPDASAMQRFACHLKDESFELMPMQDVRSAIEGADIIITATAAKGKQKILERAWLKPGQHISGIGGDSPGKTELDPDILKHANVVIEYFPQTHHEGEIQNLGEQAQDHVYAELWEIISGKKPGRSNDQDISVFDSVGFALEDFSILRLCYELSQEYSLGKRISLIPNDIADCKNLFGLLQGEPA
ncbi:MAG: ornithine cyclodeaminase [Legionella sp.]|nr:MAG: ornithine cyclodeaminase [Legionella sp.]